MQTPGNGVGVGVGGTGVGVGVGGTGVGVGVGGTGVGVGVGGTGVGVGVGPPPPVTVKFVSAMSKKQLVEHWTFILAVVVAPAGMVTDCVPSFGVPARSVVGKVRPPSVDINISTFAELTGAAVVFATFQVTVCAEPPAQLTFVFGWVTKNGPAAALTLTAV